MDNSFTHVNNQRSKMELLMTYIFTPIRLENVKCDSPSIGKDRKQRNSYPFLVLFDLSYLESD